MRGGTATGGEPGSNMPGRELDSLRAVLDAVGALVVVLDCEGLIVHFNRACERATGYLLAEVTGKPLWNFMVAEEVEPVKRLFSQLWAGQFPDRHENHWVAKDGSRRLIAWSNSAVPGQDGSTELVIGTGIDVTEHRQAEAERERLLVENRSQREFLEHLVESAPVGIAVVAGPEHRFELVNPGYQAILAGPAMPMVGRALAEVFPDLVSRGALQLVAEVYRTGQAVSVRESEAAVGPGRERTYWNVDHVPLHGFDGEVEQVLILAHQVTDQVLARRQAEDLALEAQQRAGELDAVLSALVDTVVVYDASGAPVKGNPAAIEAFGPELVSAGAAELARTFAIRHADGQPMAVDETPVSRALRGQRVTDERIVLGNARGQELILLASAAPLLGPAGVLGAVAVWHDITEQAQAEHALRESEEKLGKLFEILPVGVSVLDHNRNIVKANPALSKILDLSPEDLVRGAYGKRAYLTADGDPFPTQNFPSTRAFVEQRPVKDVEIGVVKEDGDLIWTSVSAVPVPFPDWGVVLVTADITDRKQAEEALRRERDFTAAVLDTSGGLVLVLDSQGRIVRFNRACEQATGYLFEEVQGRPIWDLSLLPEEERAQALSARLRADQVPASHENYLLARDGSRRWIAWSNTVLAGEGGAVEYVIGTGIDITERRAAEQELQRALDESRQRQAEVSALLNAARQVLTQRRFEETARSLFDTCQGLAGAAAGYMTLASQEGKQHQLLFHSSGERFWGVGQDLPVRGLRGQVCRTGRVTYDNDPRSDPGAPVLTQGQAGVDNVLYAPLIISGQVVGLLGLANKPGGFGENDARLAGAFAELLAIALHKSRLSESLEASEERFRSVVETASAAIVTTNSQGMITYWNRMAETIFGYAAQEVIGAPLIQLIPERHRDVHQAGMYQMLSTGTTRLAGETVETIGARKGGDEFPLELSLATWKTGEGTFFTALMQDITQRKQLEQALREARQSMEALIEASPLAIMAVDLDLSVRLWNPAAERIFGWSEDEVLGHRHPLVPAAGQEESEGFVAQALAEQPVLGKETVRYRKDGSPIDVSMWTAPLYGADGNVCNVVAILADVSDRKRDEEALRQYAREQAALYTVASAVAGTLDQDELLPVVLDAVLPALEADAGWILLPGPRLEDPPRVVAQAGAADGLWADEILLPNQDCPSYREVSSGSGAHVEPRLVVDCPALAAQATNGVGPRSLVCVPLSVGQRLLGVLKIGWRQPRAHPEQRQGLLLSIGRQVGVALHNAQLYGEARQVNRLRTLYELDRALAASLELRELAEATLDRVAGGLDVPAASALLLSIVGEGRPVMQLFTAALGWQEVTGSGPQAAYWQRVLNRVGDRREPVLLPVGETEALSPDHEPLPEETSPGLAVPIWGEKALFAVLVLAGRPASRPFGDQDRALAQVAASQAGQAMQNAQLYDEVRRLLREQEQTRAQLIHIEKLGALGRLTATIAHEINNPLQSVDISLTLLHEELEGSRRREKLERYLEIAEGEVRRISAIVRRMGDFYRPASERLRPTDLAAVLGSVLDLIDRELQHHHVVVERAGWGGLPLIQANSDHLKQLFLNLVLNALDAMPAGGTLRIRSSPAEMQVGSSELRQPAIRVDITDTGHGMPSETQAKVFEPFFTTKEQAAGLGLSIGYGIVEAHNGQISVTSEEGAGSTFTILLPVVSS